MTTGVRAASLTALPLDILSGDHPPYPARTPAARSPGIFGPVTDNRPLDILSAARTGARAAGYREDYYNRIHILPSLIELGPVAGATDRPFTLWNAYFGSTTLTAVSAADDGVVISSVAVPTTVKPLGRLVPNAHANEAGPATIDATFSFTFNRPDSIILRVTGTRAHLWPFAPNWRETPEFTAEFKTDIITSRSGKEQRRALRSTARRSLSYSVTASYEDRQRLVQLLSRWQSRPMLMADPTRSVRTSSGVSGSTLTVSAPPDWMAAGKQILVEGSLVTVTSVSGTTVTFTPAIADALPQGTVVRPSLTGLLSGTMTATHPTSRVAEARITLAIDPGSEPANTGEPSLYMLAGREVFTLSPNWGETVSQAYDWPVEQVDYGFGRLKSYVPIDQGWMAQTATFVGIGRDTVDEIERFFNRQQGRRGEFMMPTGMQDISLRDTAIVGTNYLRAVGTDIYDNYHEDSRYRAVALKVTGNRLLLRAITGMYLISDGLGTDTVLEFSADWFENIDPADVLTISWLPVMRFASDELTFEWPTDEVAQVQMAMRSLENLPAEDPLVALDGAAQWLLEVWGEAGIAPFDDLDWLVNVRYPAIWWWPLAWVMVNEGVIDNFDLLVNQEYPEIFD